MGFVNHPGPLRPFGRRLLRAANTTPPTDEAEARKRLYPPPEHVDVLPRRILAQISRKP